MDNETKLGLIAIGGIAALVGYAILKPEKTIIQPPLMDVDVIRPPVLPPPGPPNTGGYL